MIDRPTPDGPTQRLSGGLSPNASDYARENKNRMIRVGLWAALLAAAVAVSYIALNNIVVPIVVLILVMTPVIVWKYPRATLYITIASVCLFELYPMSMPDSMTDMVPFFWNVNTVFQIYAHVNFKAIPVSVFEFFVIVSAVGSAFRAVYGGNLALRFGKLVWPILGYMAFVAFAWANGSVTGGDYKISLQEVRSQVYFFVAYLMTVNLIRDRKQIHIMLWICSIAIAFKGILYTYRRYVTLHNMPLSDQGVGSHEEAFLFGAFIILLMALGACKANVKLRRFMWLLLPLVLLGDAATNRRAGTAGLLIAVPMLVLMAWKYYPKRRRSIQIAALVGGVTFFVYFSAFKNSESLIAQPAHALESHYNPDPRDASSNAYRDAEDADLYATIKLNPLFGYGYGKKMMHAVPIADISGFYEYWDTIPHDQILWIWMRVGTLGAIAFWMMICAIIIRAVHVGDYQDTPDDLKAVCMFAVGAIAMLMVFGLLDLQISNYRDMLFVGVCTGLIEVVASLSKFDGANNVSSPVVLESPRALALKGPG